MNITDMIAHLEKIRAEHGDIGVEANDEYGGQTALTEADVQVQVDLKLYKCVYIDM